ncbi:MAG: hypothetical protein AB1552_01860 [Nitrospirota bacterium]
MYSKGINIFSFILKPVAIAFLIVCVFGVVYLRSSYLKVEYSLGDLEKKKMSCLRERKMLLAEKTSLLSFAKLETSGNGSGGFILPDRVKVVHMNKHKRQLPYKASLESRQLTDY